MRETKSLSYLDTNSNADGYNEDGNSEFMKDAKSTVNVAINFHAKHVWRQDWQDPGHVHNVQDCDGGNDSRHKSLQFMTSPENDN